MEFSLHVLGPLQVRASTDLDVERPSHRRLLSIMALNAGRRVGTEVLIDRFWGDFPPETAKAALQTHISALRRLLGDTAIVTEGYGYRLDLSAERLDSQRFQNLAIESKRAASGGMWGEALEISDEALDLWRGAPFDELVDDDFARPQITRLEELRLELFELRAEALLALGRASEALPDLEALVAEHPLRERLWEHLMLARYRMGRQVEALRAFVEVSEYLADIGVEPGERLRRLEEKILLHDQGLAGTSHNLPVELDDFVGREVELREVSKLLGERRQVTLTGAGGSGKTRLSESVARSLLGAFPDGVWRLELAGLEDSDLIAAELIRVMGLKSSDDEPLDFLGRALADDSVLIVLDNCEHLLEVVSALARFVLEKAPGAKILATSREPLRVPGEIIYDVPGMSFPRDQTVAPEVAMEHDAVRLFANRASTSGSIFHVTDENVASVAAICRRLDGMPLAIELAAALTSALSPDTIVERLDDRFRLLTGGSITAPPRHQTLEATIDWSYQLLTPDERIVLNRLSVFRGGFDLEAAEAVCAATGLAAEDVIPVVLNLVSRSLVSPYESQVGRRYRLLETVSMFARLRLEESNELEVLLDRHCDWYLRFAAGSIGEWLGEGRHGLLDRLDVESENLQAALEWAETRDDEPSAGIISQAFAMRWDDMGHTGHAIGAVRRSLRSVDEPVREAFLRALLSGLLFGSNESEEAMSEASNAYALVESADPSPEKVYVITALVVYRLLVVDEDPRLALDAARVGLEVSLALDDPDSEALARRVLGEALSWNGYADEGVAELERALDVVKSTENAEALLGVYDYFQTVVFLHPVQRRLRPRQLLEEALSLVPESHEWWHRRGPLTWVPWVLLQSGEFGRAESVSDRLTNGHLEGFELLTHRVVRSAARWMQGRLAEARQDLLDAEKEGIHPRWYHDYAPLLVDVLADLGALDAARASAWMYLDLSVHPSEEVKKAGVLNPLVRAEIDRALSDVDDREECVQKAREALKSIEDLISDFPPPTRGSISMETPWTHLAFARAELSRATGPDPDLWREARDRADFLYFRLYARLRLAEALLESGAHREGGTELRAVHEEATRVDAGLLVQRCGSVSTDFGVDVD